MVDSENAHGHCLAIIGCWNIGVSHASAQHCDDCDGTPVEHYVVLLFADRLLTANAQSLNENLLCHLTAQLLDLVVQLPVPA